MIMKLTSRRLAGIVTVRHEPEVPQEKTQPMQLAASTALLVSPPQAAEGTDQALPSRSKSEAVLAKLRTAGGASLDDLVTLTGWQAHSVRGFLSGTVRKKMGLTLLREVGVDHVRRYRIIEAMVTDGGSPGEGTAELPAPASPADKVA